jgi:hypothetical protein
VVTSTVALAPTAGLLGTHRSTRVCGVVISASVALGSGKADRDNYRPGGLNIDYGDLFADACWSLSWSLHTRAHILQQAMIRVSFMEHNLRARQVFIEAEVIRLRQAINVAPFAPDSEDVGDPEGFPEDSESEAGSTDSNFEEEAEEE